MLELLLKIVDKLKELVELRGKRAEKVFEKFIEPIYKDMQIVHQDYLEMLHELIPLLPELDDEPAVVRAKCEKALEVLEPRSHKLEAARDTIRGIARASRDDDASLPTACQIVSGGNRPVTSRS